MKVNIALNETITVPLSFGFFHLVLSAQYAATFSCPVLPSLILALCRDPVHMSKLIEEARVRKEEK